MQKQGYHMPQNNSSMLPPTHRKQGQGYVPTARITPNNGNNGGQQPPKNPKPPVRRKKGRHLLMKTLLILGLLAALCYGAFYGKTYLDVRDYQDIYLNHITVEGVDISGMTRDEARAAVLSTVNQRQYSWYVNLICNDFTYATINYDMLGMTVDYAKLEEALNNAWSFGHSNTSYTWVFDLQKAITTLESNPYSFSVTRGEMDESLYLNNYLEIIKNDVRRAPTDATVGAFMPDESEPFTFTDEAYGAELDTEAVKAQIFNMLESGQSGDLVMYTTPVAPNVTKAELQKYYTLLATGETPISTSSPENRNNNIKVAFSRINGLTMKNGDTFSFNNLTLKRTTANGYYPAAEYAYGEVVDGIGGGVCQASTTVYLAAVCAELNITKRVPHSMSVSYTVLGQDATVSSTGKVIDFTFKNDSGYPIYITAHVVASGKKTQKCVVEIYGYTLGDGVSYKLNSVTVRTLYPPADPVYVKDTSASHVTYTDETAVYSKARDGYVVDTYLQKLQNGVVVQESLITEDEYPAAAAKYWIGVTER